LRSFLTLKRDFDDAYLGGSYSQAEDILAEVRERYGYSLWYIEARIHLLQQHSGLTAQKQFLQDVMETTHLDALVGYLAFVFNTALRERRIS
jgi:hypothetical protein